MYFPYLRGKQFELLALRELSSLPLDQGKISPIIEPLKRDTKTIETVVKYLAPSNVSVQLIVNPEHGELKKNSEIIFDCIERLRSMKFNNVVPTYLIDSDRDFNLLKKSIAERGYDKTGYSLVHLNQISIGNELSDLAGKTNVQFNIIAVNHLIALRRKYKKDTMAFLADNFVKRRRNVDYEDYEDENFSSDYFYYKQEGFTGFGDYLTIGSEYVDGGMLPYAVVIHLTYKDKHSDDIRIKHFISDNNEDTSDTAGKFYEALSKLIVFVNAEGISSIAIDQFKDLYSRGAYPGLGTVKKLSLMHHIQLIHSLL